MISGLLVGGASIYAITYYLEIPTGQLLDFFFSTLIFLAAVVVLAVFAVTVFKGAARLVRKLTGGK